MQGPQPAALNAELFSRGKDNINLLLGLLDDESAGVPDFYVRYHTVQLLTALAAASSYRMQEVKFKCHIVTSCAHARFCMPLQQLSINPTFSLSACFACLHAYDCQKQMNKPFANCSRAGVQQHLNAM